MGHTCLKRRQQGQTLLLVFLLMILLSLIIGSLALMWEVGLQSEASQSDGAKAFYIAEAALNRAMDGIAYSDGVFTSITTPVSFAGGRYTVTVSGSGNGAGAKRQITATGWFRDARREVYSVHTKSPDAPGPPYGNAWGYYKKGQNDWTEK